MNILLFGPPGSGKGTQSALLVEHMGYQHISTGDLFRSAIKNKTPLGLEAKQFLDRGSLVPDSITISLVREVLQKKHTGSFILDGFPRNIAQANALEELLRYLNLTLDRAIFLEVAKDKLKNRLVGRRVCKQCGATYHAETSPTKKDGICDICGGEVYQRADDKEDVIENRLLVYDQNTSPLKDYYIKKGLFCSVDGLGSQEAVFERIKLQIKK